MVLVYCRLVRASTRQPGATCDPLGCLHCQMLFVTRKFCTLVVRVAMRLRGIARQVPAGCCLHVRLQHGLLSDSRCAVRLVCADATYALYLRLACSCHRLRHRCCYLSDFRRIVVLLRYLQRSNKLFHASHCFLILAGFRLLNGE